MPKSKTTVARRTHRERTELSDRLMLDAALEMILEVGTRDTNLKVVGERAGYSRGLAQARYGNKETLFLRLAERCLGEWLAILRETEKSRTGVEALRARLEAISQFAQQNPDSARVLYTLWFESVGYPSPIQQGLQRFHAAARDDIKNLCQQAQEAGDLPIGLSPDLMSLTFTSAIFGLVYQWLINPDAMDIHETIAMLRGLLPTPGLQAKRKRR